MGAKRPVIQTAISDRQLEIISAAGKILTSAGVGGLTIKNLANHMKFSEAAIYRHFSSKEEIILAMLNYLADILNERYSAITPDADPVERFRSIFQEQFLFFKRHPHFTVAVFSDGLLEESQRINESIARIMAIKIKHLTPIIRAGQQLSVFRNEIPEEHLIHIVMGAVRLHMFKWRINNFQSDIKRTGDNLIQSILTLIKKK